MSGLEEKWTRLSGKKKKQKEQPTTELPNTNVSVKKGRISLYLIY